MNTGFFPQHQSLCLLSGAASSEDGEARDGSPKTRRRKAVLLSVALFFSVGLQAQALQGTSVPFQNEFRISGKSIPELRRQERELLLFSPIRGIRLSAWPVVPVGRASNGGQEQVLYGARRATPVFSLQDLAFFCRIEWRLEKAVRFPIRIRLGEVQYVDQMEGKH